MIMYYYVHFDCKCVKDLCNQRGILWKNSVYTECRAKLWVIVQAAGGAVLSMQGQQAGITNVLEMMKMMTVMSKVIKLYLIETIVMTKSLSWTNIYHPNNVCLW